jgi:hypothetical protein
MSPFLFALSFSRNGRIEVCMVLRDAIVKQLTKILVMRVISCRSAAAWSRLDGTLSD